MDYCVCHAHTSQGKRVTAILGDSSPFQDVLRGGSVVAARTKCFCSELSRQKLWAPKAALEFAIL
jgi:hypothetical protein